MKNLILAIIIGFLIVSCGTPRVESLCGHTGIIPYAVESKSGTLEGHIVSFENYIPAVVGGRFEQKKATICNPELLDSINLPVGTSNIVFTGKFFDAEDATGKKEVYLYLHDIVAAPKGFNN